MEKIIITFINWFGFLYFIHIVSKININIELLKTIFIKNKELENNNFIESEEYINIINEIQLLKSLHLKNKNGIKNIIKRLPFKGDEWEQEFIREELDELMKSGVYEELEERAKVHYIPEDRY